MGVKESREGRMLFVQEAGVSLCTWEKVLDTKHPHLCGDTFVEKLTCFATDKLSKHLGDDNMNQCLHETQTSPSPSACRSCL